MAMEGFGGFFSQGLQSNQDTNVQKSGSGVNTSQKSISQEGINKLIYDVLSSDQGLAALGGVENSSGGFKSSSKSLLSQDLMAKIVGELANVTAKTTQTTSSNDQGYSDNSDPLNKFVGGGKGKDSPTVICTELAIQGKLDLVLYSAGHAHFWALPKRTVQGYHFWARTIVSWMQKYPFLATVLAPIARSRYEHIVNGKITFWGLVTVYLGQPICYFLGTVVPKKYLPDLVSK